MKKQNPRLPQRSPAEQQANAWNSKFGVINRLDLRSAGSIERKNSKRKDDKTASQTLDFPGNFPALRADVDF
jgi:hypothetical protein